jgi:uncharacterized membrane protein
MSLFKRKVNIVLIPKWIPIAIIILAIIGFADAVYLTVEHYNNVIPPCTTGGCETVLSSQYSQFFGLPVSLLGSIYYFFIALLVLIYLDTKKEIFLRIPFIASTIGFLCSAWFVFLMIFILKAFCQYCAISATTSLIIFIISMYSLWLSRYSSQQELV